MRPLVGLSVGTVGLLMMCTALAHGQNQHLTEAVIQAQAALKQAELAKKETRSQHLEEGIRLLKEAIDHGKQGHGEQATKSAESALTHLQELPQASAETAQGDTGY